MTYREICERELRESATLGAVIEKLRNVKGKSILLFAHDDPDGIASAAIMYRILKKNGARKIHYVFPEGFDVFPHEIEAEKRYGPFDLFVVVDKGSKESLDDIVKMGLDTVCVDHHFIFGNPKRVTMYNSHQTKRPYCSAAFLCHMIATIMGIAEPIDEFDALVGLKADFCIDPTSGNLGTDFVRPFVEEVKPRWKNLFKEVKKTATLFDTSQRVKTTLLSQIAEIYFAVTGGAFQYFYPDDKIVGKFNQPRLCFESNLKLDAKVAALKKLSKVDGFFGLVPQAKAWKRCYELFQGNWDAVMLKMETATPIGRAKDTTLYLSSSDRMPLIPMVGGIVLAAKVKAHNDGDGAIVMINTELTSAGKLGTHFSLRGTGEKVHVGKICQALASKLNEVYNNPLEISGGGHPRAGECRTRNAGLNHFDVMTIGLGVLKELFALEARRSKWTEADAARALELGIGS